MLKKINIKNILLIIIPFVILIIISLLIINLLNKDTFLSENKLTDGKRFKEEYELLNNKINNDEVLIEVSIPTDNIIKYSTETEIINIINNKSDAVVYLGSPTCNYCRASVEVLLNSANDSKLNTIYYIDNKKITISDDLQNIIREALSEEKYSSLVIFINDGEIVSYNINTLSSHKEANKKLNKSQNEGLKEIYRYGINDVIASKEIKDK